MVITDREVQAVIMAVREVREVREDLVVLVVLVVLAAPDTAAEAITAADPAGGTGVQSPSGKEGGPVPPS